MATEIIKAYMDNVTTEFKIAKNEIELLTATVCAGKVCLLEGLPGTGKTEVAKTHGNVFLCCHGFRSGRQGEEGL